MLTSAGYVDTPVTNGTPYFYVVTAVDSVRQSVGAVERGQRDTVAANQPPVASGAGQNGRFRLELATLSGTATDDGAVHHGLVAGQRTRA